MSRNLSLRTGTGGSGGGFICHDNSNPQSGVQTQENEVDLFFLEF
jgi:hypothetical protein